jgi:hypothetical protein
VSGVPPEHAASLYARFRDALAREEPALLAEAEGGGGAAPAASAAAAALGQQPQPQQQQAPQKRKRWAEVVGGAEAGGGFSLAAQWGAGGAPV